MLSLKATLYIASSGCALSSLPSSPAALIRLVNSSNLSLLKIPDLTPSYESRKFHHFEWWYFDEGSLNIVHPHSCSPRARRK